MKRIKPKKRGELKIITKIYPTRYIKKMSLKWVKFLAQLQQQPQQEKGENKQQSNDRYIPMIWNSTSSNE